ncbi:PLP-dependent aspartate aminotransferase family protein [Ligilactobacillus sp. WILCCON 0076]|uniref:PLP-dependent aspartate aminotransferase family protein n=1 Tax=Ligilactobacillus ubinensis TaxID=2876789 RepID=A0A9X2JMX3_9LACO|nr:PLP-dependent aspartate aminotransferase family protein [Ligilactobacillus ubinensis]MCP0887880.1 PLP-dependent aspartate aminotransferase family protein [Ligilactobacillus ubinensis]
MTRFLTDLVHGKKQNDNVTGAVNVPVYTSTTYAYPSAQANVEYDYSRSGNPTRRFLEEQIALLEGGVAGFAFSSGVAAIHAVLATFKAGDHIIIGKQIYGGTFRLINEFFAKWNLEVTPVDTRNIAEIKKAIKVNTKAIYFEPFTNPLLQVSSVKQIARVAKENNLLTIVDNTFLTPYLQKPLALGADIVIHSATKYISGHSDVVAGLVVVNSKELAQKVYFNQNAIGSVLSPENANLVRRGLQTLGVRMDRHLANAAKVVDFLQTSVAIKKIYYPGIAGTKDHEIAVNECNGFGGLVTFEVAENVDPEVFVNNLKLIQLAVSLGAVESLIELPCKMTHAELSQEEQQKVGITPQLIRLSVGIEDISDLLADIKQALQKATVKSVKSTKAIA